MEHDCPNLHAQTHRNYAEGAHTHIQRLVVLNMEHILNVALTAHNHTSQPAGKCKEQTTMLATQNSCFLERDKWQETIESNSYEFIEGRTIVLAGNIPTPNCLHLCCFSQYPQVLESLTMFRLHLKVALAPQPALPEKAIYKSPHYRQLGRGNLPMRTVWQCSIAVQCRLRQPASSDQNQVRHGSVETDLVLFYSMKVIIVILSRRKCI